MKTIPTPCHDRVPTVYTYQDQDQDQDQRCHVPSPLRLRTRVNRKWHRGGFVCAIGLMRGRELGSVDGDFHE
jgi:hypothetical protein